MKIVKFENGQYAVQDEGGKYVDLTHPINSTFKEVFAWHRNSNDFVNCLGRLRHCKRAIKAINRAKKQWAREHVLSAMKIIEIIEV